MRKKHLSELKGYENCNYDIYEDGRVYSYYTKRFLKGGTDSNGYLYLNLGNKSNALRNPKIHRLVIMLFGDGEEKEQVNHIDGNKKNNHIDNLQWVTNRENRIHALETGLKDEIHYGIAQYDLEGNLLNVFDTAREALIFLGKNPERSGNIGRAIRGSRKTAYGYIWKQYDYGSTTMGGGPVHSSEWKLKDSQEE